MGNLPPELHALDLELQQKRVKKPITKYLTSRNYNAVEIAALSAQEPDARKAIGRPLSNDERTVVLNHYAQIISEASRIVFYGRRAADLAALLITAGTPRLRAQLSQGPRGWLVFGWAWMWRGYIGREISDRTSEVRDRTPSFTMRVLQDPRMKGFRDSLDERRREFGGHVPRIVRKASDKRKGPPVQWFEDAFFGPRMFVRPPPVMHKELSWFRYWPAESEEDIGSKLEEGDTDDWLEVEKKGYDGIPLMGRRAIANSVFNFDVHDRQLKPCLYVD